MNKTVIIFFVFLLIIFGLSIISKNKYIEQNIKCQKYIGKYYEDETFPRRMHSYEIGHMTRSKYEKYAPIKFIDYESIFYIEENCYKIQTMIENNY